MYEAEHELLGIRRALKVLSRQLADREDLAERLRLEARALAQLHHPNLVQVLDLGVSSDGRVFFAMELLVGATLRDVVARRGRLAPATAVDMACEILDALHAAHERGMVHRDVKPENIWIQDSGAAKLLDFGVAKAVGDRDGQALTQQGTTVGTPRYMAPEQAESASVDRRVDVFAVGLVLWECLVGRTPFAELDAMAAMVAAVTRGIPSVGAALPSGSPVPPALIACVDRATSRRPDDRFPTAADLRRELLTIRPLLGEAEPGPRAAVSPGSRGHNHGAAHATASSAPASYAPTEDALTHQAFPSHSSPPSPSPPSAHASSYAPTHPDIGVGTMPIVPSVNTGAGGAPQARGAIEGTARISSAGRVSEPSYPPQALDRRASPTPTAVPIAAIPQQIHTQPLAVPSGSSPGLEGAGDVHVHGHAGGARPPHEARGGSTNAGRSGMSPRALLLLPLGIVVGGVGVLLAVKWAIPDPPRVGVGVGVGAGAGVSSADTTMITGTRETTPPALSSAAASPASPSPSASPDSVVQPTTPATAEAAASASPPSTGSGTGTDRADDTADGDTAAAKGAHPGQNPAGNTRPPPPRSGPLPKSGL